MSSTSFACPSSLSVSKMEEDEDPSKYSDGEIIWNPQTTPPLAATGKEEKVRGNVFKVSRSGGWFFHARFGKNTKKRKICVLGKGLK